MTQEIIWEIVVVGLSLLSVAASHALSSTLKQMRRQKAGTGKQVQRQKAGTVSEKESGKLIVSEELPGHTVSIEQSNQSPELPAQLKPVRNNETDEMPVTTIIVDDGTGTHYQSVSIDNPDKKPAAVILKEITDTLQKNAAVK